MIYKPGDRVERLDTGETGTVRHNYGYDKHYDCDFISITMDGGSLLSTTARHVRPISRRQFKLLGLTIIWKIPGGDNT